MAIAVGADPRLEWADMLASDRFKRMRTNDTASALLRAISRHRSTLKLKPMMSADALMSQPTQGVAHTGQDLLSSGEVDLCMSGRDIQQGESQGNDLAYIVPQEGACWVATMCSLGCTAP